MSETAEAPMKRGTLPGTRRALLMLSLLGAMQVGRVAYAHAGETAAPVISEQEQPEAPPPPYPPGTPAVSPDSAPAPPVLQREDNEPSRVTRPRQPPPKTSGSYAGQIVLADLGGLLAGSLAAQATGSVLPLFLGWSLASPIVHASHGNPEKAAGSLLLHLTLPVAGALVGTTVENCSDSNSPYDFCGLTGALMGGVVGMIAATAVDATALARGSRESSSRPARRSTGGASAPALSVGRNGNFAVGWRGTF